MYADQMKALDKQKVRGYFLGGGQKSGRSKSEKGLPRERRETTNRPICRSDEREKEGPARKWRRRIPERPRICGPEKCLHSVKGGGRPTLS